MTSDTKYSGPIIGVPLYFGLGYKVFKLVRINAGMTLLQEGGGSGLDVSLNSLYLRPFVGASVEFDLWLGLNRH